MARKALKRLAVAILIGFSFWAGTAFQNARYTDKCLDLGDGKNPAGGFDKLTCQAAQEARSGIRQLPCSVMFHTLLDSLS